MTALGLVVAMVGVALVWLAIKERI